MKTASRGGGKILFAAVLTWAQLSAASAVAQANPPSPRPDEKNMSPWMKSQDKSRAQLIEQAKVLITKQLGAIDFQDYAQVTVWKRAKAYRVEFRAPVVLELVNDRGQPTQDYVDVTLSEQETVVTPKALVGLYQPSNEVRRITKLFAPHEAVRLTDLGESFEARVSRRSTGAMSGGAEAYSIDKKTLAKKMLWHEHPQARGRISTINGSSSEPVDEWVEITK